MDVEESNTASIVNLVRVKTHNGGFRVGPNTSKGFPESTHLTRVVVVTGIQRGRFLPRPYFRGNDE
jgi:hypothetical protein